MKPLKHTKTVYYTLVFLYWFANALPLALLILLLQSRGLNLFQASLLFGVNSLTVVLLEVPTGSLADVIGRKQVSIWAALLMLIGFSLFLVAFSFWLLMLGGVFYGASRALASGALDAWFVDTVQAYDAEIELQPLLATAGVLQLLGLALGTLSGGLLPQLYNYLPFAESRIVSELSLPLLASVVVQIIRFILLLMLVKEQRPKTSANWREAVTTVPSFIKDAVTLSRQSAIIRWLLLTGFAGGFVMVSLENFWQPHFASLLGGGEGNSHTFGIIMAGNFVLGAVGNMLSPLLARKLNNRLGLLAGLFEVLRGVALLVLVWQSNVLLATLFFWAVYFGVGVVGSPAGVMLHGEISAENRSTMLSIQSMVAYIGVFVGSLLLGGLAEIVSIRAAWIVGGCVLIALLLPYLKIDRLYGAKQDSDDKKDAQLQTI